MSRAGMLSGGSSAVEFLVHFDRRIRFAGCSDDDSRHARHRGMGWHIVEHHAAGPHFRAGADFHPAEDFRARAEQHSGADDRMALARHFASAAERDFMQDRHIVFYDGRFPDDKGCGVVEEDAAADAISRLVPVAESLAARPLALKRRPELMAASHSQSHSTLGRD